MTLQRSVLSEQLFSLSAEWTRDILSVFADMNGTAIENFVCVIYNVSFMNCTWHVGRTATEDTQYFLYWRPSKKEDLTECQNYIKDDCGRHTGCRFQNVTIENKDAYFLVNGSRSGQNIQSYEKKILLYRIEKLTPPLNVTVNCTEASHRCSIWWQPPRTSHVKRRSCFKYEIVIENKADAEKNTKTTSKTEAIIENNSYLYESFSSEKRNTTTYIYFTIRAISDTRAGSRSHTFSLRGSKGLFEKNICYCTTAKRPIP
uniref:Type I cytokine receptor cytokine-binding domain-containing protein n=1 Tax=Corvus moneduloides TaxID=1196302 RepID=A0A8C3EXQ4_CORMO